MAASTTAVSAINIRHILDECSIQLPNDIETKDITGIDSLIELLEGIKASIVLNLDPNAEDDGVIAESNAIELGTIIEEIRQNSSVLQQKIDNRKNVPAPRPISNVQPVQASCSSQDSQKKAADELQDLLICPILRNALIDQKITPDLTHTFNYPVTTPDGYTYERAWLLAYLKHHNNETPTGERINNPEEDLVLNRSIQDIAAGFRATQKANSDLLSDPVLMVPFVDENNNDVLLSPLGRSYRKDSISHALSIKNICPLTNTPLTLAQLGANRLLVAVGKQCEANPTLVVDDEAPAVVGINPLLSDINSDNIDNCFVQIRLRRDLKFLQKLIE